MKLSSGGAPVNLKSHKRIVPRRLLQRLVRRPVAPAALLAAMIQTNTVQRLMLGPLVSSPFDTKKVGSPNAVGEHHRAIRHGKIHGASAHDKFAKWLPGIAVPGDQRLVS